MVINVSEADILLMDGDCGLCSNVAVFLYPRLIHKSSLKFIANSSEEAKLIISQFSVKQQKADTVYLVKKGKTYIRSAAGIRCLLYMKFHYRILFPLFWLIPLPFRDLVYIIISKYRHHIFKRPNSCIFTDLK
jgi:predicted DCC family thiol-disulfide oxidoreductase YuxK